MTLRKLAFIYAALLMALLAGILLGYRYFVAIPAIKSAIDEFHQGELLTLNSALKQEVRFLQTMNYDYAVWNESYEFVHDHSQKQDCLKRYSQPIYPTSTLKGR